LRSIHVKTEGNKDQLGAKSELLLVSIDYFSVFILIP
jgi:hypothetical protein